MWKYAARFTGSIVPIIHFEQRIQPGNTDMDSASAVLEQQVFTTGILLTNSMVYYLPYAYIEDTELTPLCHVWFHSLPDGPSLTVLPL